MDTDSGVEKEPECHGNFDETPRNDLLEILQAEDETVEDERSGKDDPSLKAASGTEVSVELYVESEQEDEGNQHPGNDS